MAKSESVVCAHYGPSGDWRVVREGAGRFVLQHTHRGAEGAPAAWEDVRVFPDQEGAVRSHIAHVLGSKIRAEERE